MISELFICMIAVYSNLPHSENVCNNAKTIITETSKNKIDYLNNKYNLNFK